MTKYAMAPEAEDFGSHYVDQNFLFQFLSQNIDKIKRAAPYVLSNLVLTPYFRHDFDCSRVKHFAFFLENYLAKYSLNIQGIF